MNHHIKSWIHLLHGGLIFFRLFTYYVHVVCVSINRASCIRSHCLWTYDSPSITSHSTILAQTCSHENWRKFTNFFFLVSALLPFEGQCKCLELQESIPVGCVPSASVAAVGVSAPRACWDTHLRSVCYSACWDTPPSLVDRILDTRLWKHYLSATTLRTVKMQEYHYVFPVKHF